MAKKKASIPAAVKRESHPYWTAERLEGVLDRLISTEQAERSDEFAHEVVTGHNPNVEDTYYGRTCSRCGDEVVGEGDTLVSALAQIADEAPDDSKWRGLVISSFNEDGLNRWTLRFAPARAAEWVASQREARDAQRRMTHRMEEQLKIRVTDCLWPEERLDHVRKVAERYQREGDFARAAELLYGVIPKLENWSMMRVIAGEETRRVLTDRDGSVWIAVPISETNLGGNEPS